VTRPSLPAIVEEALRREIQLLRAKARLIRSRLAEFEKKYNMSTEQFIKKFETGELGDEKEYFVWWALHRSLKAVETNLMQAEKYLRAYHPPQTLKTTRMS